jgi:hypothetical protein
MWQRAIWFLAGVAVSSLFWIAVLNGIGQQWLDIVLRPA